MKFFNYFIILLLFLCFDVYSQDNNPVINWMTWDEAVVLQAKQREEYNKDQKLNPPPKKIFLDIYTDWCGWCKKMDASTFKNPQVIEVMNKYFYPVKLDAEMPNSVTYNNHTFVNPNPNPAKGRRGTHQLAASLLDNQMSYPSYVIMDENTSRMTIYKGFKREFDMLSILAFFGSNQYLNYKNFLEKQFKQQLNKPVQNK